MGAHGPCHVRGKLRPGETLFSRAASFDRHKRLCTLAEQRPAREPFRNVLEYPLY